MITHPKLWNGNKPSAYRIELQDKIKSVIGEENYNQLLLTYLQTYLDCTKDSLSQFTQEQIEYYEDELLCDMNAGMNVFQNSKVYAAASNIINENTGKVRGSIYGIDSNKAPPGNTNGKHYSTKKLKIDENLEKIVSRYKTVNLTHRDNGIIGKEVIR